MDVPPDFDVSAFHDLVAGLHMPYYDNGGPERQIAMMLAAVAHGRLGFVNIEAEDRGDWYVKAATALRAIDASMYCVVSEAWAATLPRADDPLRSLPPSAREDKAEVVTTVCVDRAGNRAASVKRIDRHPEGERAGAVSGLVDMPELDIGDGDMLRLLEWPPLWLRERLGAQR
ncbi:MAG TPA: hypothetical protein VGR19_12005 [Allosphingosinicella sp.]|nr:hypothetical protein [Allosphingosinicella sp.]